jgi:hypothetical protein
VSFLSGGFAVYGVKAQVIAMPSWGHQSEKTPIVTVVAVGTPKDLIYERASCHTLEDVFMLVAGRSRSASVAQDRMERELFGG